MNINRPVQLDFRGGGVKIRFLTGDDLSYLGCCSLLIHPTSAPDYLAVGYRPDLAQTFKGPGKDKEHKG
jgi:hypothetical protein